MAGLQNSYQYQFMANPPQPIGSGSFANVYEIERIIDGQVLAAKVLKLDQMLHSPDEREKIKKSFEQECMILKQLKHPNLVLYLDITHLEGQSPSDIPALVMEKMEISLAHYLHRFGNVQETLPLPTQVSFCNDIAQALAYLHLNGVIHRDLSSNNILLNGITNNNIPIAKVGDLGTAKLRDSIIQNCPLTECPGTAAYMPPEALVPPAKYGTELDIFSYGVLIIEIILRKQPTPTEHIQITDPIGHIVLVPELQRRADHINQIRQDDQLLQIALKCIRDKKEERPSALELPPYISQAVSYTYQLACYEKEKVIKELSDFIITFKHQSQLKPAPEVLKRSCNAVIGMNKTGKTVIYLRLGNDKKLYSFSPIDGSWKRLPDCKNYQCSLAVIENCLLAIGGVPELGDRDLCRNEVYHLDQQQSPISWNNVTSMPTTRARTTALSFIHKGHKGLIVTGGEILKNTTVESLKTVEVFDKSTSKWQTASDVPETHSSSSGTIVGEDVYIHGGWTQRGQEMHTIYTCTIEKLIKSCTMDSKPQIWNQILPHFPIDRATSTMFADRLVFVGGIMNNPAKTAVNNIRMYNKYTDKWLTVGQLPQALSLCFVVAVNDEYLLVIGGQPDTSTSTKDVHVFAIKK